MSLIIGNKTRLDTAHGSTENIEIKAGVRHTVPVVFEPPAHPGVQMAPQAH